MEAALATAVATAGIKVLVEKLMDVLKKKYSRLFRSLKGDLGNLQKTLRMIEANLSDADSKSITQKAIKIWLSDLEDVAFDADNVLDELNYHLLRKKNKKMKIYKVPVSPVYRILRNHKMARAIKKINAKFESMSKRAADLGIQSMVANATVAAPVSFETDSFSLDPVFIGRDDNVTELVNMLTHTHPQEEERKFSIIAIEGMGGMGKTTLTTKVFNHERVKAQFGSLIWVHVSQTFDPIILFIKILSTLTSHGGDEGLSREVILRKLQKALEAKTYLLVLDDVWNEDVREWEGFKNSMSGVTSTMRNNIIITTRSQKVASTVKPFHIHSLYGLSNEDCWSIIKAKAFDGNGEVRPEFETIGKEIAKRCGGLPLAANVVGGVLSRKSLEEWRLINDEGLPGGEGAENIQKILKLSFDYLPSPSLKKCFAYCSIFPKGHGIGKLELIGLWMGEGFLQPSQGDDMESIGNMFFNVLLQNSLLQVSFRYEYGGVCYVMHDLVHDLASSVLSNNTDGSTTIRYMFQEEESSKISKEVAKYLRTLFLKGGTSGVMFSDFQCLHNLTLGESCTELQLPDSIRKLIHLRNLDLSNTSIKDLPEWIGKLSHLQSLRMSPVEHQKLPNTLKYLANLRHLYFIHDVELPVEIGRLTSLRTLPYFRVGEEEGYHIEELGNLENLKGELAITHLERVRGNEEALKANMLQKQHLSELRYEWGENCSGDRNDESVLEGLTPHANLKKLTIRGYRGKRLPSWLRDEPQGSCLQLHNLIEIKLERCIECEEITFDHLSNLRSLDIYKLDSLERLSRKFFYNNRNLSYLFIVECDRLKAFPDGFGISSGIVSFVNLISSSHLSFGEGEKKPSSGEEEEEKTSGEGENQGIFSRLIIKDCEQLVELPCEMLELWAPTIEELKLEGLRSLKNLPMLIDCLSRSSRLKELTIRGIPNFMSVGSVESWNLPSLWFLNIDVSVEWSMESSVGINYTVNGILQGCFNSLGSLTLRGVENWEWLPPSIQLLTSLFSLKLENIEIEELPEWFGNLSSLIWLYLHGCKSLTCLPSVDAWEPHIKLEELEIENCPKLSIDSEWRNHHPNLKIKVDGTRI